MCPFVVTLWYVVEGFTCKLSFGGAVCMHCDRDLCGKTTRGHHQEEMDWDLVVSSEKTRRMCFSKNAQRKSQSDISAEEAFTSQVTNTWG